MDEKPADLGVRTFQFATRCVRLVDRLPTGRASDVVARQLAKCSTSVGANYRAARRARSTAEFIAKLGIVEEEADESAYWLDVIVATEMMAVDRVSALRREADEILAMVIASIRTAKKHRDSE